MKIDIIIPNYNGSRLIKKNLPKVLSAVEKFNDLSVIISDDASDKDELQSLKVFVEETNRSQNKQIQLLESKTRRGFSSTVNNGVFASDAELVVLLNTDVIPEKNFLDAAVADFSNDEKLFGVGCMDKSIENGKTVLRGRGLAEWRRGFLIHRRGEVNKKNTFWISGGSSIVRKNLFIKLGGFDPLFNPFYWEDLDLSFRVQKSGYSICFEAKSVVVHEHEEGTIKKNYSQFSVRTISFRNQFIFVWKNITSPDLLINHFFFLPVHFFRALLHFDLAFFSGFFLAVFRVPAIIAQRRKQKKLYKLSDKKILAEFVHEL